MGAVEWPRRRVEVLLREIGVSTERRLLRQFLDAGLRAADPHDCVARSLRRHVASFGERLTLVAVGKAALGMMSGAREVLGASAHASIVLTTDDQRESDLARELSVDCEILFGRHPLPSPEGVQSTARILEVASGLGSADRLILLLSGGGSALLTAPAPGLSLEDKVQTTQILLRAGADIQLLNRVRKRLSASKGGRLATLAAPAESCAFVLSDVVGDDLGTVASGPLFADSSAPDVRPACESLGVWCELPEAVRAVLSAGAGTARKAGSVSKTPQAMHWIVGSNERTQMACTDAAQRFGLAVHRREQPLIGEAREAAGRLARACLGRARGAAAPRLLVSGGETTVTVSGRGRGGRNQELALAFALAAEELGLPVPWWLLSIGTDGIDGPTDAAGALVDDRTLDRMRRAGVSPSRALRDNDSYHALETSGDLVRLGPTGTNVADVQLFYSPR